MIGVSILGSTGSIGVNTLRVLERFPDRFRVVGLSAGHRIELLKDQIERFQPELVSTGTKEGAEELRAWFPQLRIECEQRGLIEVACADESEILVSATVGAVGLVPTLRGIESGKTVALANKETLVIAGEIMTGAAQKAGRPLLPVDSEHNAIHQCLSGRDDRPKRIWLTASGGPFRTASLEEMKAAGPQKALKHPTWQMGPKITIDSATMMNKGLEVIEACWLFDVHPDQVGVVVHPQSTVHSMVEFEDGSLLAQLGVTDMKLPIQYALTYPERLDTGLAPLDLSRPIALDFEPPDMERFSCLRLAYDSIRAGGTAPAVLNAANEVAVAAFLEERIGFLQIPELIERTLERHDRQEANTLDDVLEADRWAREQAERSVANLVPSAPIG